MMVALLPTTSGREPLTPTVAGGDSTPKIVARDLFDDACPVLHAAALLSRAQREEARL